jgi:hypothetical protein
MFLFQNVANVDTSFTMDNNKTFSNITRILHYLSIYFSNLDFLDYLGF